MYDRTYPRKCPSWPCKALDMFRIANDCYSAVGGTAVSALHIWGEGGMHLCKLSRFTYRTGGTPANEGGSRNQNCGSSDIRLTSFVAIPLSFQVLRSSDVCRISVPCVLFFHHSVRSVHLAPSLSTLLLHQTLLHLCIAILDPPLGSSYLEALIGISMLMPLCIVRRG